LWRAAGAMSAGTAFSRATGLVRVAAITYALGVTGTRLADTYNLANTTPNIVYELFLGGIFTSVFLPMLIEAREHKRGDASALVSVSLVALAVVSALTAVGAPLIMRAYTFRIEDPVVRAAQLELASFLLRWFAPQIFFYGVCAVAQALLNARGRFAPPAFAPVVNNIICAGTLFAYARIIGAQNLHLSLGAKTLLGAGTTAGVVAQGLVLLPFLRGEGLRWRFDVRDPTVARVMRLSGYVIGYVVLNQIGLWVVLALANGVPGGVTSWQIAFNGFYQLPHGLFAVSLHTALFPDLSRAASAQDWSTFTDRFATGVRGVAYLLLPAAIGYAILAHPIARLVLAHGVADAQDADAVASVLQLLVIGLPSFSIFALCTRAFFALPDTRTPTALNALAVAANVAIAFPLFALMHVRGLALAHAAAYTLGVLLLVGVLNRRIPGGLRLSGLVAPVAKIAVAAAAMGAGVWVLRRFVGGGDLVQVGVGVGAGAILYVAFSQVAGVEERFMVLGLLGLDRSGHRRRARSGRRRRKGASQ
jgi:putative peptidoglycan lipid II flippase